MTLTAQKFIVGALTLALFGSLLAAGLIDSARQAEARKRSIAALDAAVNPQLARGRAIFTKYGCNACHSANGIGGIKNINAETGGEINSLLHVSESYTEAEVAELAFRHAAGRLVRLAALLDRGD